MSFKSQIQNTLYNAWSATAESHGASGDTLDDISSMASLVSHAVANQADADLVAALGSVATALSALAAAITGWQPSPGDGGAALKAAVSGAVSQVQSAASTLTSKVGAYQ